MIQKIRTDCAGEFMQFERCLRENQTAAQVCSPQVARFVACAETVDIGAVGELCLFVFNHLCSLVYLVFQGVRYLGN